MPRSYVDFSRHARLRAFERGISKEEVRHVLSEGERIRTYPEDKPYPSCLVLGFVNGHPLHVVAADAADLDTTFIITLYEPTEDRWESDFKTRKDR